MIVNFKYAFFVLLILLALSIVFCVVLYKGILHYYKEVQLVRIFPAGETMSDGDKGDFEKKPGGDFRIVLLGDSRISQWCSYPEIDAVEYLNLGIGGQTSAQVLFRVNNEAIKSQPDVVVVQVGINDLKAIGVFPEKKQAIVGICQKNIKELVTVLHEHNIEVVVLTIFDPSSPSFLRKPMWSDEIYSAVDEVNEFIDQLEGNGVTIINCGRELSENGRIKPEYAKDTLHLSDMGYEKLNSIVKPVLEKIIRNKLSQQ